MNRKSIRNNLCSRFCSYYKPLKKEELACGGFLMVESLIKAGKQISFENSEKEISQLTQKELVKAVCISCPFYDGDCDFILEEGDRRPCGGFLLLGQRIDESSICIDDVRNIE